MANGRVVVPAPAFTPSQYGLLSVAQDMTGQFDGHWQAGVIYTPLCSAPGSTYDECLSVTGVGAVPEPPAKAATFTNVRRGSTPFTVIARKDCSTPTYWNEATQQVEEALTEAEAWQVERTFWTGIAGGVNLVHPHLASNANLTVDRDVMEIAATALTVAAVDVVRALGLIEGSLADNYQGVGVIHVPAALGPAMTAWGLIKLVGGRYVTANGNLVALGRGYPGTSPAGAAVTTTRWIYGTGAVFYARSELRDYTGVMALVRSDNTLQPLAERTYVLGWDCVLVAAEVDLTKTITG